MKRACPALALPAGAEDAGCCAGALATPITTKPATVLNILLIIFLVSSRLRHNVNQRRFATLDGGCGATECRPKVFGISDSPFRMQAHTLCDLREIDMGIRERRAHRSAIHSAVAFVAHPLHVHDFLMIATVVQHHEIMHVQRMSNERNRGVDRGTMGSTL